MEQVFVSSCLSSEDGPRVGTVSHSEHPSDKPPPLFPALNDFRRFATSLISEFCEFLLEEHHLATLSKPHPGPQVMDMGPKHRYADAATSRIESMLRLLETQRQSRAQLPETRFPPELPLERTVSI